VLQVQLELLTLQDSLYSQFTKQVYQSILMHQELMQTEYFYQVIGDRKSPKEWTEAGRVDNLDRARKATHEILSSHYPRHISDALDQDLRKRFPVKLPREVMSPGNPRWA
jgi:trimethylamine:corrinoid methyltransferase-like protein